MTAKSILILNGPGLGDFSNVKSLHGETSVDEVRRACELLCDELGYECDFRQTDDNEEMVRWIADEDNEHAGVVINPYSSELAPSIDREMIAFPLSSTARMDQPVVEVHLTNIFLEEENLSTPLPVTRSQLGFICGLGANGYRLAIRSIVGQVEDL